MTRFGMSGIAVIALVLGALLGFLGSAHWPGSRQGELNDALEKSTSLERQVKDLRAEMIGSGPSSRESYPGSIPTVCPDSTYCRILGNAPAFEKPGAG